jgi:hypothetical protein
LPDLDNSASRELYYLQGSAGTSASRVYPFEHFGLARLRHTIEPTVEYLFVPRTGTRQAALPLFDDVDRINQRSVFTYGVTSRLIGRSVGDVKVAEDSVGKGRHPGSSPKSDAKAEFVGPPLDGEGEEGSMAAGIEAAPSAPASGGVRELARFSIFQSYDVANQLGDFIGEVDPDTNEILPGNTSRASDLSIHLRLTPTPYLAFDGKTDYSVTGGGTKSATVGLLLSDPRTPTDEFGLQALRGRTRVGIGYRFVANQAVEEVNGSMFVRIMKQLFGAYEARYDNRSGKFLEHRAGLRLISNQECWVVDLGVSKRVNPDETEVRVLVSLVGLAQFGKEPFRQSLGAIAAPIRGFMGAE